MNISFLSSGHYPDDDRIFHHMGKSLAEKGHKVEITSSKTGDTFYSENLICNSFDGERLTKNVKTELFIEYLLKFCPDLIICSEPLPVIAAKKYKWKGHAGVSVIYDITEWYPSWRDLYHLNWFRRSARFLKRVIFNLSSAFLADAFIFGESYKSLPYRILFPFKRYAFVTYYPDLKYINYTEPAALKDNLRLLYPGRISLERGIGSFINVIRSLAEKQRDLKIEVQIIGWYETPEDEKECEALIRSIGNIDNITLSVSGRQPFIRFCENINTTDLFLELRSANFVTRHSLPIKLFYYMAAGRPVIISDLKVLKRELDVRSPGYTVNPEDTDSIVRIISAYLTNNDLYLTHCRSARKLAEDKYNWQLLKQDFTDFIESFPHV